MFSVKIYFRLLRLNYSNTNLLKIYYSLQHEPEDCMSHRIESREEIKEELQAYLEKINKEKSLSVMDKALFFLLPPILRLEYLLQNILKNYNNSTCERFELDNINQYYNTLYTEDMPHSITEMLLEQKNKIESYLLSEM